MYMLGLPCCRRGHGFFLLGSDVDEVALVFHKQVCPYLLDRKWRDTHSTAANAANAGNGATDAAAGDGASAEGAGRSEQ
jgi:hypothetical protein